MTPQLQRRLNAFDLVLVTISAVIGSGIFRTPAIVAQRAHLPALVLGCWIAGGAIALTGAFVFAELATRRPLGGGIYGYLKDAFHPIVGFSFAWTLMLVSGTGANAAAAVLFAEYLAPLTGISLNPGWVATGTLFCLAGINILGVRQGGNWQIAVVGLKIAAIAVLIVVCLAAPSHAVSTYAFAPFGSGGVAGAIGVAMLPVLFSYQGFQGATYVTAEAIAPERTIPRAMILGMTGILVIYILANASYVHVLGVAGLAASTVPAAAAMQAAIGPFGEKFIALAIALSTLGYLSTCMLAHPRIYYHMAADGLFFRWIAWVSPKTRVPVAAILVQATVASAIALSGSYERIVNWVVGPQWLFIALAASALFVFRRRDADRPEPFARVPGHPYTTALFIAVVAAILFAEIAIYPRDVLYGAVVLATGVVTFYAWRHLAPRSPTSNGDSSSAPGERAPSREK
ncbi:MAG: amino acid permease [Candidatus Eremiobacteraeota bacterium]|nr:amino acid permease [Candidatus Eremiobacteraeota bacterium]